MKATFPLPENGEDRRQALLELNIIDSLPEQAYDDFAMLAAVICGTPIALITFLDDHRQWCKSKLGLERPKPRTSSNISKNGGKEQEVLNTLHSENKRVN